MTDAPLSIRGGSAFSRLRAALQRAERGVMTSVLLAMLLTFYFFYAVVISIPAGHGGVLWKRFAGGTQIGPALAEGVHLKFPWDRIDIYDLRLQQDTRPYVAIANDGLAVSVAITSRFRLVPDRLAEFHKNVGPDYVNIFIAPVIDSAVREIISRHKADELYAQRRQRVQVEAQEQVADRLANFQLMGTGSAKGAPPATEYVMVQDILVRDLQLPEAVAAAIESKIRQDQAAQEYQFRLQREQSEASRKQIEAQGIRAYLDTLRPGLDENLLRWRAIEATLALAQSPNAKTVVVGNSSNGGFPVILGVGPEAGGAPGKSP